MSKENTQQQTTESATPAEIDQIVSRLAPVLADVLGTQIKDQLKDNWTRSLELASTDSEEARRTQRTAEGIVSVARTEDNTEQAPTSSATEDAPEWEMRALQVYLSCRGSRSEATRVLEREGFTPEQINRAFRSDQQGSVGMFVPQEILSSILEYLRAKNTIRKNVKQVYSVETGTLGMGKQNTAAEGYWVAEGKPIGETEFEYEDLQFVPRKLGAIMTYTAELLKNVDNVRTRTVNELQLALGTKEDQGFLFGDGSKAEPLGIFNQMLAANKTQRAKAGASSTIEEITSDIVDLMRTLMSANHDLDPTGSRFTANPYLWQALMKITDGGSGVYPFRSEIMAGRLFGQPIDITNRIENNYVTSGGTGGKLLFTHYPRVAIADGPAPSMMWSSQGTVGGVSLFENELEAMRITMHTDILLLFNDAMAAKEAIDW